MATELDYCEYADDPAAQVAYPTNGHHAVTFNGTAQLDTAQKKFGSASLLLDGDSDYLTLADSADWDIQTNFTINFFVKHDDHAGNEFYLNQREDASNNWQFRHDDGTGLLFYIVSGGSVVVMVGGNGEITDADWHHIAFCKVGNEYGIYKDGTQVSYVDDASIDTFTGTLNIGRSGGASAYLDGHMDKIRISHANEFGAAPNVGLTNTITVPTAPLQIDTDTKLLLHLDGANGATSTIDSSRLEAYSESSIKEQGSYSLKGFAKGTNALNDTLTRTVGPTIDLSGENRINLDIRSSRTGSNIKIGIHDSGGTTTELTPSISVANAWEKPFWDISAVADADKNAIDQIIVTIVNADGDSTFYLDNVYAGNLSLTKSLTGTLALTDTIAKETKRTLADTLAFTDTIVKKTKKILADNLAFTDTIVKKTKKALADTIAFTDALSKTFARTLADTIAFTDGLTKKTKKSLSDTISFVSRLLAWHEKVDPDSTWTEESDPSSTYTEEDDPDSYWEKE